MELAPVRIANAVLDLHPLSELLHRALEPHHSLGQDDDMTGKLLGLPEVVGGQDNGQSLPRDQSMDECVELVAGLGVEAGGRLVEKEDIGVADKPDGDVEPPPLATGAL